MSNRIDPVAYDRQATASTRAVLAGLTTADLDRPAPSTDWSVRQVLSHLVGGNIRFGQAVRGEPFDWASRDSEPVASVHGEFDSTMADFAATIEAMDPTRPVEFEAGTVPAWFVVNIHASDMLVHGWDLGLVSDHDVDLDPDLCRAAIATLGQYPDSFWGPGRYFAARREPAASDPKSQLLALTGRDYPPRP